MDDGKKVWVPHAIEGFKLGRIIDIGADAITVEPFDSPGQVTVLYFAVTCCSHIKMFYYFFVSML